MDEMILSGSSISYSYGKKKILHNLNAEVSVGEVVALLGPNGSGKSTLLKVLAGILPLEGKTDTGRVFFHGQDLQSMRPFQRARRVAYVAPELIAQFPLTSYEIVAMGRSCQSFGMLNRISPEDRSSIQAAMEDCHCWDLRDRDIGTLSGGERQLVAIARALAQGARALLLDESFGRMDLNHQALMGRLLKRLSSEGYGVILVSHDVNLVTDWVDCCFLMRKGQLVATGPIREVLTLENLKALYPGADLLIAPSPATGMPKVFFR